MPQTGLHLISGVDAQMRELSREKANLDWLGFVWGMASNVQSETLRIHIQQDSVTEWLR